MFQRGKFGHRAVADALAIDRCQARVGGEERDGAAHHLVGQARACRMGPQRV